MTKTEVQEPLIRPLGEILDDAVAQGRGPVNADEILARIRALYPDAVIDVAGEDCSFELYIISDAFAGQNTLQRQKPILALFKDDIRSGALHALSIKAKTPDEHATPSALVQLKL